MPISRIKILNPDILRKDIDDKGKFLDILMQLEYKGKINIEMQMNWHRYLVYMSSTVFSGVKTIA